MTGAPEPRDSLPHVIVGTAGHIDHGKTALVKALTGIDADRLEEEKRRGITIELGFVFMETEGLERQIVFIDVPGHEKLIRTMVAGSANIDAALLVVAANEGVSAQTREHLDILRLLEIPRGVIALTKVDLADADLLALVRSEVEQAVEGSFLAAAPIVPVSAVTGEGVEELHEALTALAEEVPPRVQRELLRIPIDRSFTMHGFGTVIAGTILSGEVAVDDDLEIYPLEIVGRVRGIVVHNEPRERSSTGRRTAINISGVDRDSIRRGQWAGRPGELTPTWRVDARLNLLSRAPDPLRNGARVRVHIGTGEILARVALLNANELAPADSGPAQIVLEQCTVALPGDRFVMRSLTPVQTIGGGVILDAHPERHRRFHEDALHALESLESGGRAAVEQVFAQSEAVASSAAEVAVRLGKDEEDVAEAIEDLLADGTLLALDGMPERYVHIDAYRQMRERALEVFRDFFAGEPFRLLMLEADLRSRLGGRAKSEVIGRVLDDLLREEVFFQSGASIGITGREPELSERQQRAAETIERIYRDAGFAPPREAEVCERINAPADQFEQMIVSLIEGGSLVRIADNVTFHAEMLREAEKVLREYLAKHQSIQVAAFRDHLGVSRKYALALLEYFDGVGVTIRRGDERVLAQ